MINSIENRNILIEKCIITLKLGGKSNATVINYKSAWNRFFQSFSESKEIDNITDDDIFNYFINTFIKGDRGAEYYNLNICAISYLYSVCFNRQINRKLLPCCKLRKRLPEIISKKDFLMLVNNDNNIEHKCWLLLAFCSGLRVAEVATIKLENIYPNEHKLRVLGKGNKVRLTILPDVCIKFIKLYRLKKGISSNEGYLFKGIENRDHISEKTITNYFTHLQNKYNLSKNITFHSLRHSFATYFLMNGGDILALKSMMGHRSLNSTVIYLHLAQDFNKLEGINYA